MDALQSRPTTPNSRRLSALALPKHTSTCSFPSSSSRPTTPSRDHALLSSKQQHQHHDHNSLSRIKDHSPSTRTSSHVRTLQTSRPTTPSRTRPADINSQVAPSRPADYPRSFTIVRTTKQENVNINCLPPNLKLDKTLTQASHPLAWTHLPSNLLQFGKGMVRRRNLAFLVAAEAQKEANAATVLLKCIDMFGQLCSSASPANPHISLAKFFALNQLLEDSNSKDKPLEVKAATAAATSSRGNTPGPMTKTSITLSGPPLIRTEKLEWAVGEGMREVKQVREALLRETRTWFLKFLEGALDGGGFRLNKKMDAETIALTLSHLKQSNEWLDAVDLHNNINVERLKNKVYACLLLHVDSAATALETRSH